MLSTTQTLSCWPYKNTLSQQWHPRLCKWLCQKLAAPRPSTRQHVFGGLYNLMSDASGGDEHVHILQTWCPSFTKSITFFLSLLFIA